MPEATTVNVAEAPTGTVRSTGWVVIWGAWLAVYRTNPASRAATAARVMCAGVSKSGIPKWNGMGRPPPAAHRISAS